MPAILPHAAGLLVRPRQRRQASVGGALSAGQPSTFSSAGGVSDAAVRIESLTKADVASAVELAVRVLRVKPGDRGDQFTADITSEQRQMFVAKANGRVVAYGRVLALAAGVDVLSQLVKTAASPDLRP
jgi:hypothetical protein